MADSNDPSSLPEQAPKLSELPPEAIAFAGRMYDAARSGDVAVFQQALPAGLPANMTNDKGDSLVRQSLSLSYIFFPYQSMSFQYITLFLEKTRSSCDLSVQVTSK